MKVILVMAGLSLAHIFLLSTNFASKSTGDCDVQMHFVDGRAAELHVVYVDLKNPSAFGGLVTNRRFICMIICVQSKDQLFF